jgi:enamine deaminase RidA (YjgF/YER057c/UK114 family)
MAESGAMDLNLTRSTRLFPGAPYAYASIAHQAGLIFSAGACPLDEQGRVTAPGDIGAQMRQALGNLQIALEESGVTSRDVLKTTVYVASSDRDDLVTAWNEVAAAFGDHDVPSTLLGVTVLGYPGQLVEIEAIAAVSHPAGTPAQHDSDRPGTAQPDQGLRPLSHRPLCHRPPYHRDHDSTRSDAISGKPATPG